MRNGKRWYDIDEHICHTENRKRPSPIASFSSCALSPENQRFPDGLGEILTEAWPQHDLCRHTYPPRRWAHTWSPNGKSDPFHSSPPRKLLALSYMFPLIFAATNIQPNLHNSLRAYCSLRSGANEGRVSKTLPSNESQDPFTDVSSPCVMLGVKAMLALADLSIWLSLIFIFSAPPSPFQASQVSSALVPFLPPHHYPLYDFMFFGPRQLFILSFLAYFSKVTRPGSRSLSGWYWVVQIHAYLSTY